MHLLIVTAHPCVTDYVREAVSSDAILGNYVEGISSSPIGRPFAQPTAQSDAVLVVDFCLNGAQELNLLSLKRHTVKGGLIALVTSGKQLLKWSLNYLGWTHVLESGHLRLSELAWALRTCCLDRDDGTKPWRKQERTVVPPAGGQLTAREAVVLALLLAGQANKEIADWLSISERTAKFHVSNILSKFHVSTRNELAQVIRFGQASHGACQSLVSR